MEAVGKILDINQLRPKVAEETPLSLVTCDNPIHLLNEKMAKLEDMLAKHQFLMAELNPRLKPAQKIEG